MKKLILFISFIAFLGTENTVAQFSKRGTKRFQKKMNKEFKNPEESPLPKEEIADFKRLDFFKHNRKFRVKAKFVRIENTEPFEMKTTTDRLPVYEKYGKIIFKIKGEQYELFVYQNHGLMEIEGYEDYLFLPFTDNTNGNTTYGGGRFIDLKIPKSDEITLNFNKAYNPYCAYNKKYSCPIPPRENHLDLSVEAGVKTPKGH